MANSERHDDPGQKAAASHGEVQNVTHVFYIFHATASLDDMDIPLASPQIELGSGHGQPVLCLTMLRADAGRFQEAWQKVVHSRKQADERFIDSGLEATPTHHLRYRTQVHSAFEDQSFDVRYRMVRYAELRSGISSKLDVKYSDVTYTYESHYKATYSAARGMSLLEEEPLKGVTIIPLTIRGKKREGLGRVILQVDGIKEVRLRESLAGPDLIEVCFELATTLPVEKLIWLIESE